jgi:hypothetical protein
MFDRVAGYGALPTLGFWSGGSKSISAVSLDSAFRCGRLAGRICGWRLIGIFRGF